MHAYNDRGNVTIQNNTSFLARRLLPLHLHLAFLPSQLSMTYQAGRIYCTCDKYIPHYQLMLVNNHPP